MWIWGDYYAGECVHGQRPLACRQCVDAERSAWRDAVPLLVAVLAVVGFLLLGARAVRIEEAAEREQLRQHLQRLEGHQPGAVERLREIAADVRRKE